MAELELEQTVAGSGLCPTCNEVRTDWRIIYQIASIGQFGVVPHEERAIGARCPVCNGRFALPEPPSDIWEVAP